MVLGTSRGSDHSRPYSSHLALPLYFTSLAFFEKLTGDSSLQPAKCSDNFWMLLFFRSVNVKSIHPFRVRPSCENHFLVEAFLAATSKMFIRSLALFNHLWGIISPIKSLKMSCMALLMSLHWSLLTGRSQKMWSWFAFWLPRFLQHSGGHNTSSRGVAPLHTLILSYSRVVCNPAGISFPGICNFC